MKIKKIIASVLISLVIIAIIIFAATIIKQHQIPSRSELRQNVKHTSQSYISRGKFISASGTYPGSPFGYRLITKTPFVSDGSITVNATVTVSSTSSAKLKPPLSGGIFIGNTILTGANAKRIIVGYTQDHWVLQEVVGLSVKTIVSFSARKSPKQSITLTLDSNGETGSIRFGKFKKEMFALPSNFFPKDQPHSLVGAVYSTEYTRSKVTAFTISSTR